MNEEEKRDEQRAWHIDISGLSDGRDAADVFAADSGDPRASQRLIEKTIRPGLAALPIDEWMEARDAVIEAALAVMFSRKDA